MYMTSLDIPWCPRQDLRDKKLGQIGVGGSPTCPVRFAVALAFFSSVLSSLVCSLTALSLLFNDFSRWLACLNASIAWFSRGLARPLPAGDPRALLPLRLPSPPPPPSPRESVHLSCTDLEYAFDSWATSATTRATDTTTALRLAPILPTPCKLHWCLCSRTLTQQPLSSLCQALGPFKVQFRSEKIEGCFKCFWFQIPAKKPEIVH